MGKYETFADVTEKIIAILKDGLVPELISDSSHIGVCTPDSMDDLEIGIYLYRVSIDEDYVVSGMQEIGLRQQTKPPIDFKLKYVILIKTIGENQKRLLQEQRIMGKITQLLYDNSSIISSDIGLRNAPDMRISFLQPASEDTKNVLLGEKYQFINALYYEVAPVEIESEIVRNVQRVRDIEMSVVESR